MSFLYLIFFISFLMCMIGAHELILEKVENAFGDDNDFLTFDGLRVKKFNRTSFVISGKYNLKIPLDDEIDMKFEAFNFQGGQYKKIGEKKLNKFCKSLYTDTVKKGYARFYEASAVQIPFGTCPFPAGKNELTNYFIPETDMIPPYLPGGEKWRADFRFFKQDVVLGGYNLYVLLRSEQLLLKG